MTGLLLLAVAAAVVPHDDSLAARIRERIATVPGAEVGVAFHRLGHDDTLYLNADSAFHAASTMKVPVMIELFRQVDARGLSLDQRILLVNQFGSIVDGSLYSLDPGDDSDSAMYRLVGERVSVRDLMFHMITRSSNLATNALIALVGAERTEAAMRTLGAMRIRVLRGVEDQKAFDRGLNNTTTARDLAIILEAIQENRAASAASCAQMRDILLHQEFNDAIPAGLPAGTPVAHKTGDITGVYHDAAIVYPKGGDPYVLVVLTRGIPDHAVARSLIADISRLVYRHVAAAQTDAVGTGRR
jgi:beta-lactamase class A